MVLCLCVCCCQKVEEQWIRRMSEQQSAPEQLAAGKSQGGAGATYKVLSRDEKLVRSGRDSSFFHSLFFYFPSFTLSVPYHYHMNC